MRTGSLFMPRMYSNKECSVSIGYKTTLSSVTKGEELLNFLLKLFGFLSIKKFNQRAVLKKMRIRIKAKTLGTFCLVLNMTMCDDRSILVLQKNRRISDFDLKIVEKFGQAFPLCSIGSDISEHGGQGFTGKVNNHLFPLLL